MAKPHQFPWMVGIEVDGFIFCGASLISKKWVLTAAHCAENAIYVDVSIGAHKFYSGNHEPGRMDICAENTITHPQYSKQDYDITLIELPELAVYSPTVGPVCLPPRVDSGLEYPVGEEMRAVGWGYIREGAVRPEDILRTVDKLPMITDEECRSVFNADLGTTFFCVSSIWNGIPGHGTCNVYI